MVAAPRGVCVVRVIRPPAKRDEAGSATDLCDVVALAATPGSDDQGHSRADDRAHFIDGAPLLSELQLQEPREW
jgi:hypothetical protein